MSKLAELLKTKLNEHGALTRIARVAKISLPQLSRVASGAQTFVSPEFVSRVAKAMPDHEFDILEAYLEDCADAAGYSISVDEMVIRRKRR